MSRKDYKAAADVIARELERAKDIADARSAEAVGRVARALADMFCGDNSRFDYGRFYTACGLDQAGQVIG